MCVLSTCISVNGFVNACMYVLWAYISTKQGVSLHCGAYACTRRTDAFHMKRRAFYLRCRTTKKQQLPTEVKLQLSLISTRWVGRKPTPYKFLPKMYSLCSCIKNLGLILGASHFWVLWKIVVCLFIRCLKNVFKENLESLFDSQEGLGIFLVICWWESWLFGCIWV